MPPENRFQFVAHGLEGHVVATAPFGNAGAVDGEFRAELLGRDAGIDDSYGEQLLDAHAGFRVVVLDRFEEREEDFVPVALVEVVREFGQDGEGWHGRLLEEVTPLARGWEVTAWPARRLCSSHQPGGDRRRRRTRSE